MLFSELQTLTGGKCKYDQFLHINDEYMTNDMTKEQAANLWRALYVKPRKPRERRIRANHAEIQRSGVTLAQFNAACRAALRKAGLEGWIDMITSELMTHEYHNGETFFTYAKERPAGRAWEPNVNYDPNSPHEEIYRQKPGNVQYYLRNKEDGSGYNFIYEFSFDDERTGFGCMFVTEF